MADNVLRGLSAAASIISAASLSPLGEFGASSWMDELQPASFRGVPFAVRGSEYRRGRRFALHEYPDRDLPWPEDMGRATRAVGFSGFVVGDDCYQQAQDLLDAAEQPGAGPLVHPSLGYMIVALIEPLVATERADLGRVVEIRFEVVEAGEPIYPGDETSTQDAVSQAAGGVNAASASDFGAAAGQSPDGATAATFTTVSASGSTVTYTDNNGLVTMVPANQGSTPYQAGAGGQTVQAWGDGAQSQVAAPNMAAGATGSSSALPAGMTYGRYDPSSPAAGFTDAQVEQIANVDTRLDATRAALASQVAARANVSAAAGSATSTAFLSN